MSGDGQEGGTPALHDRENQEGVYRAPRVNMSMADFDLIGRVGDGSFSTVVLARHRETGREYAIKLMNKHLIMRNKMVDYIKNERNILDRLNDPGVAKLHFTFQDPDNLYMGMEHCHGGELYEQINKKGKLPLSDVRFYAAELVLILEYLRSAQVVHRDLKPENLLLSRDGHLKLADFGSAKAYFLPDAEKPGNRKRATSFVGTAEYVSPEVLLNKPLSYPADLWALGCLIFQMITGKPPFKGASEYLTFQKVTDREFEFPADEAEFPPDARDLVDKLLAMEPEERLGASDMSEVKAHLFFSGVDWATLRSQPAPSYIPPTQPTPEEEALDWEMTSLVRSLPQPQQQQQAAPQQQTAQ